MIKLNVLPQDLNAYIRELAKVAVVLSDNYMKDLYTHSLDGYICCVDQIHEWAVEFMEKFYHLYTDDWEEFCYSDTNPYNGRTDCWDDVVIAFGQEKMDGDAPIHFICPENAMYSKKQGIAIAKEIIAGKVVELDYKNKVGGVTPLYFAIRNTRTKGKALLCSTNPTVPNDAEVVIANFAQGLEEPLMMWAMGIKDRLAQKK